MSLSPMMFNSGDDISRFRTITELLEDVVYRSPRMSMTEIAAALDLRPSELTRMLHRNEMGDEYKRNFPLEKLPLLIQVTGDQRIIKWLIQKFMVPDETKRQRELEMYYEFLSTVKSLAEKMEVSQLETRKPTKKLKGTGKEH